MKTTQTSRLMRSMLTAAGVGSAILATGVAFDAAAQIVTTRHNLSSSNSIAGANRVSASNTGEVCVFCHTPHGSDTSAPVPLWNKRINSNTVYTTYESLGSSTLDAVFANDGTPSVLAGSRSVGSVSVACLSCHDGTQAMDNLMNSPGSGGLASDGGGTGGAAFTWQGSNVSAAGVLSASSAALLGTDLRNDHPIGIQYCGGYSTGSQCKDKDFIQPVILTVASTLVGAPSNWVDTTVSGGTANVRDKTDMILFNRSFASVANFGAGIYGSVECATCHDVHKASFNAGTQVAFLRVTQSSSALCLSCHIK